MEEKLRSAIKRTKEYGRKFGVEYTEAEVKERLISETLFPKIKSRVTSGKTAVYRKKIKLAKRLAKEIGNKFKAIMMVGVTGSVAAGYPLKNSDIDLMIITEKDSLWITRLQLRFYVWLRQIPHRRYGIKENSDELCFNLWIEEDNLLLPEDRRTLKNAMDLILMKPMFNKKWIYERLIEKNDWANKFVANRYMRIKAKNKNRRIKIENHLFRKIINWLVFWPQRWYMRGKIGEGLVNLKMAFFHPNNDW